MNMYENCFARIGNKCGVLKEELCDKGKCPFYKTKEQYAADLKKYPPIKK